MNIMQCQFCRKPFASLGGKICPDCLQQIDKDFVTVRDYIDENRWAGIDKISKETEVPRQHIIHLIKEGRLILDNEGGDALIVCESCKKPIKTGRLCEDCQKSLTNKMEKTTSAVQSKPKPEAPDNFKSAARVRR